MTPRKGTVAASTSSSTDEAGTKGENTIDEILLQQFEPTRASSSKVAELDEAFKMEPVTEDVTKLFNCLVDLLPTEGRNATTSREINAARKEKVADFAFQSKPSANNSNIRVVTGDSSDAASKACKEASLKSNRFVGLKCLLSVLVKVLPPSGKQLYSRNGVVKSFAKVMDRLKENSDVEGKDALSMAKSWEKLNAFKKCQYIELSKGRRDLTNDKTVTDYTSFLRYMFSLFYTFPNMFVRVSQGAFCNRNDGGSNYVSPSTTSISLLGLGASSPSSSSSSNGSSTILER